MQHFQRVRGKLGMNVENEILKFWYSLQKLRQRSPVALLGKRW
jgi:hypothetical protein